MNDDVMSRQVGSRYGAVIRLALCIESALPDRLDRRAGFAG